MKVAKVEQFFPRNRMRLVKITTDNGLVGWGESTLEGRPKSTCAAIDEMADYLVGKDPLRIEHHWQHIYRSSFFRGGSVVMSALSGIDQALWDIAGKHYGVPSAHQPTDGLQHEAPALMVPHPWTRSVNSILFLPDTFAVKELRGHGIGCEYDSRFLIRFTIQNVGGILQGASYRFSLPEQEAGGSNFIGPICSAVSPKGELYIGSIWDSGWQGGLNTGGITKLIPDMGPTSGERVNGIQELTATPTGFEVTFFRPVDTAAATDPASWYIQENPVKVVQIRR